MRPAGGPGWSYKICPRSEAERWEGRLTPIEREAYRALATPKRKLDWLSGRAAAKLALGAAMGVPPETVEVLSRPDGRPYCTDDAAPPFSITHTAAGGLCAVAVNGYIGCDWEMVVPRSERVLEFYTTPKERAALKTPADQTRLWAGKEAVLKLLGLGLSAEPTDVRFEPKLELHYVARRRWEELGRPAIRLEHINLKDSIIAVAFTEGE